MGVIVQVAFHPVAKALREHFLPEIRITLQWACLGSVFSAFFIAQDEGTVDLLTGMDFTTRTEMRPNLVSYIATQFEETHL